MNIKIYVQATAGQSYSQSFVCRLERMDVTVRQAKEASRILRKWLEEADHKYCFLNAGGKLVPLCFSKNVAIHAKGHTKYVVYLFYCEAVLHCRFPSNLKPKSRAPKGSNITRIR